MSKQPMVKLMRPVPTKYGLPMPTKFGLPMLMWEIFLQAFPTASTRPGAITTRSSRHRNFREPELTTTTRSYHDPELTTSQFSRSSRQRPGAITTRSSRHHYHQDRTLLLVFSSSSPFKMSFSTEYKYSVRTFIYCLLYPEFYLEYIL